MPPPRPPPPSPCQAYANSKLATLLTAKHLDRLFAAAAAAAGGGAGQQRHHGVRDAAVAVHPGLVDTALARGYFKQTPPRLLRPLTDPFFDRLFCPYLLRRWAGGWCGQPTSGASPWSQPRGAAAARSHAHEARSPSRWLDRRLRHLIKPRCRPPRTRTRTRPRTPCLRSPAAAAETVLYAATAPADEVGGQYVGTAPRVSKHSQAAGDAALAARLWELSAHMCSLDADERVT